MRINVTLLILCKRVMIEVSILGKKKSNKLESNRIVSEREN